LTGAPLAGDEIQVFLHPVGAKAAVAADGRGDPHPGHAAQGEEFRLRPGQLFLQGLGMHVDVDEAGDQGFPAPVHDLPGGGRALAQVGNLPPFNSGIAFLLPARFRVHQNNVLYQ